MSDKQNDGGPAFPSGRYTDGYQEDGSPILRAIESGLTALDWFAGQMAPELLRAAHETFMLAARSDSAKAFDLAGKALDQHLIAASAYDFAEAMLAEKEKRRNKE